MKTNPNAFYNWKTSITVYFRPLLKLLLTSFKVKLSIRSIMNLPLVNTTITNIMQIVKATENTEHCDMMTQGKSMEYKIP